VDLQLILPLLRLARVRSWFIDGKKKYWCTKCNQWTFTHPKDSHKTKEELKAELRPAAGMSRVDFNLHPSAFMAMASKPSITTF